jgi:hypothetical protein
MRSVQQILRQRARLTRWPVRVAARLRLGIRGCVDPGSSDLGAAPRGIASVGYDVERNADPRLAIVERDRAVIEVRWKYQHEPGARFLS